LSRRRGQSGRLRDAVHLLGLFSVDRQRFLAEDVLAAEAAAIAIGA